jgi:hypothetical protein
MLPSSLGLGCGPQRKIDRGPSFKKSAGAQRWQPAIAAEYFAGQIETKTGVAGIIFEVILGRLTAQDSYCPIDETDDFTLDFCP